MVQSKILEAAEEWIPRKKKTTVAKTHDWLTDDVVGVVQAKKAAEGTPEELAAARACSEAITAEFAKFAERSKKVLLALPKGSKAWWRKARCLALQGRDIPGIASLKDGAEWKHTAGRQGQPLRESL